MPGTVVRSADTHRGCVRCWALFAVSVSMNKSSIAASSAAIAITEDVNTIHVACCAAISRSVVDVMASADFWPSGPSRSSEIGKVLVTDDADALQPATRGLEASLSVPLDSVNHPGWSAVDWMT